MKKESVKKNFIYNILYQMLVLVLPLVTAPYLSRIIGGDSIGIYSYTHAFANYFVLFTMLGVNNYGNRSIARVRDNCNERSRTFWSIYAVQAILAVILSIIYILYIFLLKPDNTIIYFFQIFYVISAGLDINWFFFGMEKFKITVTRNMLIKILTTIAIFIFIKSANDLWLYTLIISAGTLISQISIWPFLVKNITIYIPSLKDIKKHIIPNLKLFIPVIAISLYNIMDKLMLGNMSTYEEVGYYTYAEKIAQVPVTIIIALGTVMMPHVSNLMAKGKLDECKRLFDKGMLFVMFMSFAFTFGMANLSPDFSIWYYGSNFARSGLFLVWLSPVIIFKSWANIVRTQFIMPAGQDNIYIISVITGAIVNLCMNTILIPKYAGIGAVVGTIFAEFSVFFVQAWKTRKQIAFVKYLKYASVFCIIGIIMYISMCCIGKILTSLLINLVLRFLVGTFTYCLLAIVYFFYLRKKDIVVNEIIESAKKKFIKQ